MTTPIDPENTARLKLPYIMPSQAQKHVTHNEALRLLDALVQPGVLDRDLSAPPAEPDEGAHYIVGPSAAGAWAGKENHLAAFMDGAWFFPPLVTGMLAYVVDEARLVVWTGTVWADAALPDFQNLAHLGIGTTADATNTFAAKLENALWTAKTTGEGGSGDLRLQMNKETEGNTLSLIFQTNWSGRAEFGLAGGDDFIVKVSPDGADFHTAIEVDRNNGLVKFPSGLHGTGSGAGKLGAQIVAFAGERGASAVGQNLAFGNGQATGPGVCMPFAGKLIAATIAQYAGSSGTYTLEAVRNGALQGSSYQLSHVYGGSGVQHAVADFHSNALSFAAGDQLTWQVAAQPGTGAFVVTFFAVFD